MRSTWVPGDFFPGGARRCRRTLAGCLADCPAGSGVFPEGAGSMHTCIVTCSDCVGVVHLELHVVCEWRVVT